MSDGDGRQDPIWGIKDPNQCDVDSDSSGNAGQTGGSVGCQSERGSRTDSERAEHLSREKNPGGILRQLKALQAAHLAYVDAHQERLKKRLKESDQHKSKILEEMKQLEEDLMELLQAEEEKTNPD